MRFSPVLTLLLLPALATAQGDLPKLADDFWQWRASTQPFSGDDIPRIERPDSLVIDLSAPAVAKRRVTLAGFEARWKAMTPTAWTIPQQVDYQLMGSAIARVHWELDIERSWLRNPRFYFDQTVGPVFEALTPPAPISAARLAVVKRRLESIPATVEAAKRNLTDGHQMARPFALLAIENLKDIGPRMRKAIGEIAPDLAPPTDKAIAALEDYRNWLEKALPGMAAKTAVGREAYLYFVKNVALMPFTPEELLAMGRQEWERAVSFETYERTRNRAIPDLPLAANAAAQMARENWEEEHMRTFLGSHGILTVPDWVGHYRNLPLPAYLGQLAIGVTDDLTGPSRLKENAVSYIRPPAPTLGYFSLATAKDPRPILVHEGIPGHYFQLALSWAHEDPIRRHFYDSGANEGIGFYAEEMMLQAGYFDDSPHTREIIYNFMRLRALRVEVDVKLALGLFTIEQAAAYLEKTVPMDKGTSLEEASDFASWPGQAISYQIGKLQILALLADARRKQGEGFDLQRFHDFVWKNGNVPLTLQRWELLGEAPGVMKPVLPAKQP